MLNKILRMSFSIAATSSLTGRGRIQCHLFAFLHAVMSDRLQYRSNGDRSHRKEPDPEQDSYSDYAIAYRPNRTKD